MKKNLLFGEIFNTSIKNKSYEHMTAVQNVYIGKLDNLVNQHNNTYNRTIRMKPVDGTFSTYMDFDKNFKLDVGDHVRMSKYKNIFA